MLLLLCANFQSSIMFFSAKLMEHFLHLGSIEKMSKVARNVYNISNTVSTFRIDHGIRGVETVGPVSPIGHGHLRSDSNTVLSAQMSERAQNTKMMFGLYLSFFWRYSKVWPMEPH